jgi:hypothetical protein
MKTNVQELIDAVEQFESLGDEVSWSVGTITNDRHAAYPVGKGYSVTLVSGTKNPVWEKGRTLSDAASRAISRFKSEAMS